MRTKIPKIRIRYNRLLDPIFIFYCKNNPELKNAGWNDWTPPSKEEVLKRVENYKIEWEKHENDILNGLCDITKLNFKKNIMDVHIVSGNPRQFSRPIIIKSGYMTDEFINVLIHEFIHELFSQNIDIVYKDIFKDMFPNESRLTQNHVIAHAILKYIYLDVLKNEIHMKKNLEISKAHSTNDYARAWEIVEKRGYKELITEFKERYKKPPVSN